MAELSTNHELTPHEVAADLAQALAPLAAMVDTEPYTSLSLMSDARVEGQPETRVAKQQEVNQLVFDLVRPLLTAIARDHFEASQAELVTLELVYTPSHFTLNDMSVCKSEFRQLFKKFKDEVPTEAHHLRQILVFFNQVVGLSTPSVNSLFASDMVGSGILASYQSLVELGSFMELR